MRAHFVDTLLARLEGAVSPIWITMVFVTDAPPSPDELHAAWQALFDRTPKLGHAWTQGRGWQPRAWSPATLRGCARFWKDPADLEAWRTTLASEPAQLDRLPALRIDVTPLRIEGAPRYAVAARIHHALGDARALGRTLARLWRLLRGHAIPTDTSPLVLMRDRDLLAWAASCPGGLAGARKPQRRLLTRRALALPADGATLGRPIAHHTAVECPRDEGSRAVAETFLAGVLVATARRLPQRDGTLRLRMPVDLAPTMGWGSVLANTCMAIPLELQLSRVRALRTDPDALRAEVRHAIDTALAQQRPLVCALEAYLSARVVPRTLLRRGATQGFFDAPRTNTLVTTFVGQLDDYVRDIPFDVHRMISHTSTWGAHAWSVGDRMGVNVTSFEGLWHRATLAAFARDATDWMLEHGLVQACSPAPLWEAA